MPEGGGQTATIVVTLTDEFENPVEGAKIVFDAHAFELGERTAQLSQSEVMTDAFGKVTVTYTTLASDDKRMVDICVSAFKDPDFEQHNLYQIIAANKSATVNGVVRDPYTGARMKDIWVCIADSKTMTYFGCVQTDSQGRYSLIVPTGTHQLNFDMPIRDIKTVKASSSGKTYTVNVNKGILTGVATGIAPGTTIMAFNWSDFDRNSPDNFTLGTEVKSDGSFAIALDPTKAKETYELFVVGRSNPFVKGIVIKSGQVTDVGTVKAN